MVHVVELNRQVYQLFYIFFVTLYKVFFVFLYVRLFTALGVTLEFQPLSMEVEKSKPLHTSTTDFLASPPNLVTMETKYPWSRNYQTNTAEYVLMCFMSCGFFRRMSCYHVTTFSHLSFMV